MIFTVIEGHTDVHHACIAFTMIGAHLLRQHHRLPAEPLSGAAAYSLGQQYKILTFGQLQNGCLVARPEAFHCWIECKGYVIDFLAPLFPDNMAEEGDNVDVPPRRVLMKPLKQMSESMPQRSSNAGTFQLVQNIECQEHMRRSFYKTAASVDLQRICNIWYRKPPKSIPAELSIRDDLYNVTKLELKTLDIQGFW